MKVLDDIEEYKLNHLVNDAYDENLEEYFDDPNYYAQPKNTKVFLSLNGKEELIGNAVVANIEESNEKIPVYSYNSATYQKYLQGKKIVTGVIALRKITISNFLSMMELQKADKYNRNKKQQILDEIEELKKINHPQIDEIVTLLNKKMENLDKVFNQEVEMYTGGKSSSIDIKNNLINYIEDLKAVSNGNVANGKIRILFEGYYGDDASPKIEIRDVLFLKKQTEVSVERNDIFEVYSFIGNPV